MSAPGKLADAIAGALHEDVHVCTRVWEAWSHGTMSADDFTPAAEDPDLLDEIAAAVLAAGYQSQRTLTTREEVEALTEGAVIIDSTGDVAQRRDGLWCSYETSPMNDHRMAKYLPATVLHEGGVRS